MMNMNRNIYQKRKDPEASYTDKQIMKQLIQNWYTVTLHYITLISIYSAQNQKRLLEHYMR